MLDSTKEARMINLNQPIDLNDAGVRPFLADVQGNIIKGHGRDYTAHIFLRFPADTKAVRAWIADFATRQLTSAETQLQQTERFRKLRAGAGEPFAGFLLSTFGYDALGIPAGRKPNDPLFLAGLKKHNTVQGVDSINDPPVTAWEQGFQSDLHAMVLLADDDRQRLDGAVSTCVTQLNGLGVTSFVERGDKLRYDFGPPRGLLEIEHFGHQDGVSNPRMVVADIEEEKKTRGAKNWDPAAPLALTFVQEPQTGGHGSYMVFRKLEQNVRAFHAAKHTLAQLLNLDADGAAGLMVGRQRDGTPVIPTTTLTPTADPNDFNFSDDRPEAGVPARLCPFHSHIRRTNPRGDVRHYITHGPDDDFERSMRIARRGITYGERPHLYETDPWALPEHGVGLLFMSFQGKLQQFAIQQGGSDGDTFPFVTPTPQFSGLESVIGQAASGATVRPQPWPYRDPSNPQAVREYKMMNFVRMLGGEYFFAPSVGFLCGLAKS
jgi:deferrochelatase/peroxidase EfeB